MRECYWVDFIKDNIALPISIDYDNQYYPSLCQEYEKLILGLSQTKAPEAIIDISKQYSEKIKNAIQEYYKGNIIQSHAIISNIFDDCCTDNIYAISDVNTSIAFSPAHNESQSEVQFFRARLNENVVDYSSNEMSHIPFGKRSIVKSERFSIPGLPCLYLGNTSYVCWIEMGCPADYKFNVSPIVLDNSQKVFNLAIDIQLLYNIIDSDYSEEIVEKHICDFIKLFMLNIATSFVVKEKNRVFKSEYLISQMLMIACKSKEYNGITYYSKQVCHEAFATIVGVNLVLFAEYNGEDDSSPLNKHIRIGDSFNFSMFKHLMASLKYNEYPLRIDNSPFINCIGTFKRKFPYKETDFYDFDRYLFANWNPIERSFEYDM